MSAPWSLESEDTASEGRFLWLYNELFALRMDYLPELVARLKALKHRAYVPNRHWWLIQPVPEAVFGLRQIVDEFGFSGSDEALHHLDRIANLYRDIRLDRRLSSVGRYIYRSPSGDILFHFPTDYLIADNIRILPAVSGTSAYVPSGFLRRSGLAMRFWGWWTSSTSSSSPRCMSAW